MDFYKVYLVGITNPKIGKVINVYANTLMEAKKIALKQETEYKLYK